MAKASLRPFVYPKSGTYQQDRYYSVAQSWEKVGHRRWRAKLTGPPPETQWVGKRFIFWDCGRGHCFSGRDLKDCLFEDDTYWGGGGNAGFYLSELSGTTTFRHFVIGVPPGSNRMLSCAGGGKISYVRGKLVFENCDFTRIDDDGIDILGTWSRFLKQGDPRSLVLQSDKDFQAGDHVALWDWPTKRARSEAVVVEVKHNPDSSVILVLDRDLKTERTGAGDGIDRVIDLDTVGEETTIRNCRFQVFRAKCLNLKANHCTVEGCTFFDSWQPAISAASEWYFEEGPPIHDLTIRNNRFLNCNHSKIEIGAGPSSGYDKATGGAATSRDSTNILIEGNYFADYGGYKSVFKNYYTIGDASHVQNANHIIVRNNVFSRANPTAPNVDKIRVNDCNGVVIEDNDGLTSVSPAPLPRHSVPMTAAEAMRVAWYREAKFGMFIHWGLYSAPAGEWEGATDLGEWFMMSTHLLNVGPTAEGVMPPPAVERLEEIGQWLKVNGEAIYGAGPTQFGEELGAFSRTRKDPLGKPEFLPGDKWRFTTKPGKRFVILYKWPSAPLELPVMKERVKSARLLAASGTPPRRHLSKRTLFCRPPHRSAR